MVRNPYRLSAHAVGFLFWTRGSDVRMQGAEFQGGASPTMRVWWTGRPERPYEWAVLDRERGSGASWFSLFQLGADGAYWNLAQGGERQPILGTPGEATFTDINRDGVPEVVHWALAKTDSLFEPCADCPKLTIENTYVEREEGFVLQDSHLMPTGYAAFVTLVRRLLDRDRAGAARLLASPADVTKAVAQGWSLARKPGTWKVEYGEPGEPWPHWIEVRFAGPQGVKRYIVRFAKREDRWIVESWTEPKPRAASPPSSRPAAPGGGRTP